MALTNIPWADHSINPLYVETSVDGVIRRGWGCTEVSPGCDHCYSERRNISRRFDMGTGLAYDNTHKDYKLNLACFDKLPKKRSTTVFVQSMSDLFHPDVPDNYIAEIFQAISINFLHKFLILTKRPGEMKRRINNIIQLQNEGLSPQEALKNYNYDYKRLGLGVSVELDRYLERLINLLETPAAMRFVSLEPLLGEIKLFYYNEWNGRYEGPGMIESGGMTVGSANDPPEGYDDSYPGLDWVIVGAETGPHRRPCKLEWVESIIEQCMEAQTPCFVKQIELNGKINHNPEEWPEHLRVREMPRWLELRGDE